MFTLGEMECMGACVNAPMIAVADYTKVGGARVRARGSGREQGWKQQVQQVDVGKQRCCAPPGACMACVPLYTCSRCTTTTNQLVVLF